MKYMISSHSICLDMGWAILKADMITRHGIPRFSTSRGRKITSSRPTPERAGDIAYTRAWVHSQATHAHAQAQAHK
jgi:ethanolamine ammonia-lyase small subunit